MANIPFDTDMNEFIYLANDFLALKQMVDLICNYLVHTQSMDLIQLIGNNDHHDHAHLSLAQIVFSFFYSVADLVRV